MEKQSDKDKDRVNYEWDVDRMINEGMAGGTVHRNNHSPQIEEARQLKEEEPPKHN
ncbi:hypothetical protein [Salibacterium salarium]|uniref:hypothetical protein n=1 Tax=Salibacterium salarium TaxID=284579 RepID=UPI00163AED03|nr:hypothetical protein [Salibacterium salarium]